MLRPPLERMGNIRRQPLCSCPTRGRNREGGSREREEDKGTNKMSPTLKRIIDYFVTFWSLILNNIVPGPHFSLEGLLAKFVQLRIQLDPVKGLIAFANYVKHQIQTGTKNRQYDMNDKGWGDC